MPSKYSRKSKSHTSLTFTQKLEMVKASEEATLKTNGLIVRPLRI